MGQIEVALAAMWRQLARRWRQPSAAAAESLAVAGRGTLNPSNRGDACVAPTMPSESFLPCAPPQRRHKALATNAGAISGLTLFCLALLAAPLARGDWISDTLPPITEQEKKALELVDEWSGARNSEPILGLGGQVLFVYGLHAARIVCAPLRVCDLALQTGETLSSDPHLGDSARWLVDHAESGPETARVSHLLIKPLDAGLSTTLYIPTSRRSYHLELLSHPTDYMPSVGFLYPEALTLRRREQQQQLARTARKNRLPGIPVTLDDLDFDYEIDGSAAWRPVRVFNDGSRTFIEFPGNLQGQQAPILLVLDGGSEAELVNYRVSGDRYVVDGLFQLAALLAGTGKAQQRVTIRRVTP